MRCRRLRGHRSRPRRGEDRAPRRIDSTREESRANLGERKTRRVQYTSILSFSRFSKKSAELTSESSRVLRIADDHCSNLDPSLSTLPQSLRKPLLDAPFSASSLVVQRNSNENGSTPWPEISIEARVVRLGEEDAFSRVEEDVEELIQNC